MTQAAQIFRFLLQHGGPAVQDLVRRVLEIERRKRFPTRCHSSARIWI